MNKVILIFLIILYTFSVKAHKNNPHGEEKKKTQKSYTSKSILNNINKDYVANIKPILIRSCGNCHNSERKMPWYYKIPGVKQLIDSDIRNARKHLVLDNDFPFGGHGSPAEDLKSIIATIKSGSMPPWRYRLMHSDAALSGKEKERIEDWVKKSLLKFKK